VTRQVPPENAPGRPLVEGLPALLRLERSLDALLGRQRSARKSRKGGRPRRGARP
jgi:hypothetical protein